MVFFFFTQVLLHLSLNYKSEAAWLKEYNMNVAEANQLLFIFTGTFPLVSQIIFHSFSTAHFHKHVLLLHIHLI